VEVKTYPIQGPMLTIPKLFGDHRGFFMESYNKRAFAEVGIDCEFVQDNHSKSAKGILRGLHYQVNRVQAKLVRCVRGEIFDVAVDIRPDSPTYGQWIGEILSAENHAQLFVPRGFAHGFQALTDGVEVLYKCDDFYSPQDERGVIWNDPDLNIQWPLPGEAILSEKDRANPTFRNIRLD